MALYAVQCCFVVIRGVWRRPASGKPGHRPLEVPASSNDAMWNATGCLAACPALAAHPARFSAVQMYIHWQHVALWRGCCITKRHRCAATPTGQGKKTTVVTVGEAGAGKRAGIQRPEGAPCAPPMALCGFHERFVEGEGLWVARSGRRRAISHERGQARCSLRDGVRRRRSCAPWHVRPARERAAGEGSHAPARRDTLRPGACSHHLRPLPAAAARAACGLAAAPRLPTHAARRRPTRSPPVASSFSAPNAPPPPTEPHK